MSRIDDELEQAVSDAGGDGDEDIPGGRIGPVGASISGASRASGTSKQGAGGDDTRPVVADTEPSQRSWGLLAGLCALGAGILVLVFNSTDEAVVYAYGVKDLNAKASELGERQVRVIGDLVSGTLTRRDDPCEYRFNLRHTGDKAGETLKVHYAQCVVPDQFRDVKGVQVEVTAEGRMSSEGHLEASKIFAKCPSKYEMKESAQAMGERPDHGGGQPKPEFIAPRAEGIR
jgi:cytochrome c-type biogenesis protein CcmE